MPRRPQATFCPQIGAIILALVTLFVARRSAYASESGVSTYKTGLLDMFAGYLPRPGTGVSKTYFVYGDSSGDVVTADGKIEINARVHSYIVVEELFYGTKLSLLGSNWALGVVELGGVLSGNSKVGPTAIAARRWQTSTVGGLCDIILVPIALHWNFGQFHLMSAASGYAPTGAYDKQRMLNLGKNRWALESDAGLTWMNEKGGEEVSLFVGYTTNLKNPATHYRSGDEFHTDFAVVEHLRTGLTLGIAGYAFQQVTGDSGSGAILGPFKGRVLALGPLVDESFRIGEIPFDLAMKYELEFEAQNRGTGDSLWVSLAFKF
jgi:hypothetical protein